MNSKKELPIALILDEYVNGLGLARSLGRDKNIPVWGLLWEGAIVGKSKYLDKVIYYKDRDDFENKLLEINALGRKVIPFFAKDVNFKTLNQLRDQLPHFSILYHDIDILDKNYQTDKAESSGILIPQSVDVLSPTDLNKIEQIEGPYIVKPTQRNAKGETVFRAVISEDLDVIKKACQQCFANDQTTIVAEYIPGGDDSLYTFGGYAHLGKLIEVFNGRKLVQKPRAIGTATTGESLPDLDLEPMCSQFIKDLNYSGLFQLEFKRSTKNDKFYFIEFNPRNWLWSYCSTIAGANLPLAKYYTESKFKTYTRATKIAKTSIYGIEGLLFNILRDKWPGAIWITLKANLRNKRHAFFLYKWNDNAPLFQWAKNTFSSVIGKRNNRR
jgi:predicted ATP-grasp superfamily ATP-dependent carboligase